MTGILKAQLGGLAGTLAGLREKVRAAVAGELGRAVGDAVRQVVQAVVADRADPPCPRTPASHWGDGDEDDRDPWGRPRDPWGDRDDDDDDNDAYGRRQARPPEPSPDEPPNASPAVAAAVTAGVFAARWWLLHRGTLLAAAGLGLGVGLLGVAGGPLARTAVAVLAATAEVLTATDALGDGAARLEHL